MPLRNSPRTDNILAAATKLFARQGYHGTSTREIARLAKVSENTLFRHFDNKEDIFWSALRSQSAALRQRWEASSGIKMGAAPQEVLPKILELLSDIVNYQPEVLKLFAIAFLELRGKTVCRDLLKPFVSDVSCYLAVSIEKGDMVEVDPTLLAASLISTTLMHSQFSKMTRSNNLAHFDNQGAAAACTRFWLNILTPKLAAVDTQQFRSKLEEEPVDNSALVPGIKR